MDPLTQATNVGVVAQVGVSEIQPLIAIGVLSIVGLLLILGLVQAGLSVFYARALNSQVSQGINALVGVNNMTTIDQAMEDQKTEDGGDGN